MLNLLSWNVRYFSQRAAGVMSTTGTLERSAAALAALNPQPDIVALQEIDDHSIRSHLGRLGRRPPHGARQLDHFVHELNEASARLGGHTWRVLFYRAHNHDKTLPLISTGLAILYRDDIDLLDHNAESPWPITHMRIPQLSRLKQRRVCAYARFRSPCGEILDVFNTHLSLPAFLQRHAGQTGGRFGEADNQVEELRAVLECAAANADLDRTVLVGDFNSRPGSRVYRLVQELSPLRDAFADHHGLDAQALTQIPTAGFLHLQFRLDHFFAGPRVATRAFPLAHPWRKDHPMRGLSDHAPMMGELAILAPNHSNDVSASRFHGGGD